MLRRPRWIASRSLSSGAHSRDPLARNDGLKWLFEIESVHTVRRLCACAGTTLIDAVATTAQRRSLRSQLPCIAEGERGDAAGVFIKDQRAGDWRLGALAAVFAFAEP